MVPTTVALAPAPSVIVSPSSNGPPSTLPTVTASESLSEIITAIAPDVPPVRSAGVVSSNVPVRPLYDSIPPLFSEAACAASSLVGVATGGRISPGVVHVYVHRHIH